MASISNKAVSNNVYTEADIDLKWSSLVGAAPAVLNTSVELATALGNDSKDATTIQNQINSKSAELTTYPQKYVNVALSNLQAGIDNRVLVNAVDINGKFKISAVSNDVLKIQRVDGTTLYDSFELSFNPVNKTSILTSNNVDIVQAINNDDVAVNVHRKSEFDTGLNLKADKTDNFQKLKLM